MIPKTNNGHVDSLLGQRAFTNCEVVSVDHLARIVFVKTSDGQVFYLRAPRQTLFLPDQNQKVRRAFCKLAGIKGTDVEKKLAAARERRLKIKQKAEIDRLRRNAKYRGYKLVKIKGVDPPLIQE